VRHGRCSLCYILNSMYRKALHASAVVGEIVHRVQGGVTKADQYATRTNGHRSTMVSRPSLVKIDHRYARIIPTRVEKIETTTFAAILRDSVTARVLRNIVLDGARF
jgi:hypothetical protein